MCPFLVIEFENCNKNKYTAKMASTARRYIIVAAATRRSRKVVGSGVARPTHVSSGYNPILSYRADFPIDGYILANYC